MMIEINSDHDGNFTLSILIPGAEVWLKQTLLNQFSKICQGL